MKLQRLPKVSLPGPPAPPVIGSLLGPMGNLLRFFSDPIVRMRQLHARYGRIAGVTADDPSLVCVFGPEFNRQVLSEPRLFHNAAELPIRIPRGSSLERLNHFLVGMNDDQHASLRKLMTPLFQKSHLQNYRDSIVEGIEAGLAGWQVGDTVDMSAAMQKLALCISMRAFYGLPLGETAHELAAMAEAFTEGATAVPMLALPVALPGLPYRAYLQMCDRLEQRLLGLFAERRARPEGGLDTLSLLLQHNAREGSAVPDKVLLGLTNELFIAGHKTSAATLAWTLFLLDQHPRVLESLVAELDARLHGQAPTIEQLDQLPLLDAVLKESMRLLPASPFLFFRRTTRAMSLGDVQLPAGASLVVSPLITHHMPELYRDPGTFRPARWLEGEAPDPYGYLPFGAGARKCIGAAFASIALRTTLAVILQRYTLRVFPGTRVDYKVRGIIMGTRGPLPMLVDRRAEGSLGERGAVVGTVFDLLQVN